MPKLKNKTKQKTTLNDGMTTIPSSGNLISGGSGHQSFLGLSAIENISISFKFVLKESSEIRFGDKR